MWNRIFWLWVLTAGLLLLPSGHAAAGDDVEEQARRHFERGVELAEQGSHEQAVTELTAAYELRPDFSVLWNLAQAYAALDKPIEALEALEQYERDGGEQIEAERRTELDEVLATMRGRVGLITIVVQPEGASVAVDGNSVGRAPLNSQLRLLAGEHRISARLDGYKESATTVTVPGGKLLNVDLLLEPDQPTQSGAGQLQIECPVPGVSVAVNGKPIGKTPFFGPMGVPRGRHEISFVRPGYTMAAKEVDLSGAEPKSVSCGARLVLPVPPKIVGTVSLTVNARDPQVVVDGQPWPADGRLPAGPHVMSVRKDGFAPVKVDFTLEAGQEKQLRIGLVSLQGDGSVYRPEEGASAGRVLAYVFGIVGLAAGGTAFGLAIWNDGRSDEWETERDAIDQDRSAGALEADLTGRQTANDDLADSIETIDAVALGLGIGGGALVVTGIILFLATGDSEQDGQALYLGPQPGGGYVGWATSW